MKNLLKCPSTVGKNGFIIRHICVKFQNTRAKEKSRKLAKRRKMGQMQRKPYGNQEDFKFFNSHIGN